MVCWWRRKNRGRRYKNGRLPDKDWEGGYEGSFVIRSDLRQFCCEGRFHEVEKCVRATRSAKVGHVGGHNWQRTLPENSPSCASSYRASRRSRPESSTDRKRSRHLAIAQSLFVRSGASSGQPLGRPWSIEPFHTHPSSSPGIPGLKTSLLSNEIGESKRPTRRPPSARRTPRRLPQVRAPRNPEDG